MMMPAGSAFELATWGSLDNCYAGIPRLSTGLESPWKTGQRDVPWDLAHPTVWDFMAHGSILVNKQARLLACLTLD